MVETVAAANLRTRHSFGGTPQVVQNPWAPSPAAAPQAAQNSWGQSPVASPSASSWNSGYSSGQDSGYSSGQGGHAGFGQQDDGPKSGDDGKLSPELFVPLAVLLVTAFLLHADQNLAAPNLSAIANDFQMTPMQKDSRLGGFTQFVFYFIGGLVSLLIGPLADQMDRVTLLCIVVLSGAVPSLLMSMMTPSTKGGFFYYLLARICTGVSVGGSYPVLFSLCADLFPPSWIITITTWIGNTCNGGAGIGALMSGIVGSKFGWRTPYKVVAVPAIACAIALRLLLTDPRTTKRAKRASEEMKSDNSAFSAWMGGQEAAATQGGYLSMSELDLTKFQRIMTIRTNRIVFMQSLPGCIPLSCIVTFLADYLATEQGMTVESSTFTISIFGVCCLVCAITGGWYGSVIYSKKRENLPLFMCLCACISPLPFIALVNAPKSVVTTASGSPTFVALLIAAMGGIAGVTGPNVRSALLYVNGSGTRGTAFSAFALADDMGKGLGPTLVVMLTAIFGHRVAYTFAFMCWWISAGLHFLLHAQLPADASRNDDSFLPRRGSASKHV